MKERFIKRLSKGKKQHLSKGGRTTLIKSTLSSLQIYCMSLFIIPKKMCLRLEKIQRDLPLGKESQEKKLHLMKGSIVCMDKKKGSLSIKDLANLNKALLGKWNWRCFGGGGLRDRYGVALWKAIRRG